MLLRSVLHSLVNLGGKNLRKSQNNALHFPTVFIQMTKTLFLQMTTDSRYRRYENNALTDGFRSLLWLNQHRIVSCNI